METSADLGSTWTHLEPSQIAFAYFPPLASFGRLGSEARADLASCFHQLSDSYGPGGAIRGVGVAGSEGLGKFDF